MQLKYLTLLRGGALISPSLEIKNKIDKLKNFGFLNETTVISKGINGKMGEINAAFGLLQLKFIDQSLAKRKTIDWYYRNTLAGISGIKCFDYLDSITPNYGYFPIFVNSILFPISRDKLYEKFKDNGVYVRRYFYPLISDFIMYKDLPSSVSSNLPEAKQISSQVLCLPIYPELSEIELDNIVNIILDFQR